MGACAIALLALLGALAAPVGAVVPTGEPPTARGVPAAGPFFVYCRKQRTASNPFAIAILLHRRAEPAPAGRAGAPLWGLMGRSQQRCVR
jgi:hypothetical protein